MMIVEIKLLMIVALTAIAAWVLIPYIEYWLESKRESKMIINSAPKDETKIPKAQSINFKLTNKTDSVLDLDLCCLSKDDDRYSFTSNFEYDSHKFIEYIAHNPLHVLSTAVYYNHDDWQKDIITLDTYGITQRSRKPIFIGVYHFDKAQILSKVIRSNQKYKLDYFNTLLFQLQPKEEKDIVINYSDTPISNNDLPLSCAVSLKNSHDELKRVSLFDEKFYELEENKDKITLSSLFKSYLSERFTLSGVFDAAKSGLFTKKIRIFHPSQKRIKISINKQRDVELVSSYVMDSTIAGRCFFDVEFPEPTYINSLELEIDGKSEMIICLS